MVRRTIAWRLRGCVAGCAVALLMGVAGGALGAPCAGFSDVDDTSGFCPGVEWIRNRAITLGCTSASAYCPNDAVSRLAMAAFMNRLGTALTPVHLPVDASPGAVDLDVNRVVCQTADFAVTGFPRRAHVDASFNGTAPADVGLAADVVMSSNGGASFAPLNAAVNRGLVPANQWGNLADLGFADLAVGQTVRFGVRVTRGGAGGGTNLSDSRCQLRVLLHSRNGILSPL